MVSIHEPAARLIPAMPTAAADPYRPLADRLRPQTLDEFVGQQHLLSTGKPLRLAIENGRLHSMVL